MQRLRSYDGPQPTVPRRRVEGACGSASGKPIPKRSRRPRGVRRTTGPVAQSDVQQKTVAASRAAGRAASSSRICNPEKRNSSERQQRPAPPPRSETVAGRKDLRHARRARCQADRPPGRGSQPRRDARTSWACKRWATCSITTRAATTITRQLKPIKNLFYGEQVTVIGTIQSVHTRPIRGGKASIVEIDHQRWHRRAAPVVLQPALAGEPLQAGRCHFGLRQGRSISRPPRDEQSRLGIGRGREPAHQPHRADLFADRAHHPEVAAQVDEAGRRVLGAQRGGCAAGKRPFLGRD